MNERIEQAAKAAIPAGTRHTIIRRKAFVAGANFALQNQWISVDDELPPVDERTTSLSIDVMVRDENGICTAAWYSYSAHNWHLCKGTYDYEDVIKDKITHWMEIPTLQPSEQLP